jgi:translation initiation factor IF-1
MKGDETTGVVIDELRASCFKVKLDHDDRTIVAKIAAQLAQHCIRVHRGDAVIVELAPYNPDRGRITWRYR